MKAEAAIKTAEVYPAQGNPFFARSSLFLFEVS